MWFVHPTTDASRFDDRRLRHTEHNPGPKWTFESKLPLVASDGRSVAYSHQTDDGGLGWSPTLEVSIAQPNQPPTWTASILTEDEYRQTAKSADGARDVGELVARRIGETNAHLEKETWAPMLPCEVDDTYSNPTGMHPCSMKHQSIRCGERELGYLPARPALELRTPSGKPYTVPKPTWRKPPVPGLSGMPPVPLVSCVLEAWHAAEAKLLVLRLTHQCTMGGDWCTSPNTEHVVRLPY